MGMNLLSGYESSVGVWASGHQSMNAGPWPHKRLRMWPFVWPCYSPFAWSWAYLRDAKKNSCRYKRTLVFCRICMNIACDDAWRFWAFALNCSFGLFTCIHVYIEHNIGSDCGRFKIQNTISSVFSLRWFASSSLFGFWQPDRASSCDSSDVEPTTSRTKLPWKGFAGMTLAFAISNGILSPNEMLAGPKVVGLRQNETFAFLISVYGSKLGTQN